MGDDCGCERRVVNRTDGDAACGCPESEALSFLGPHPGVIMFRGGEDGMRAWLAPEPAPGPGPGVSMLTRGDAGTVTEDDLGLADLAAPVDDSAVGAPFVVGGAEVFGGSRRANGIVDIYLRAGPVVDTPDDPSYRSCDLGNVGSCRLYRLGWNFDTMTAVSAERISGPEERTAEAWGCTNGLGQIQPALSPDRRHLAWAAACHEGPTAASVRRQEVWVKNLILGKTTSIRSWFNPRHFPEWEDDDTILFQRGYPAGGSVWSTDKKGDTVTAILGADAGGSDDYKNPRVHPAPTYQSLGMPGHPRVATFGVDASGFARPQVSKLDGTKAESFSMGPDATFEECHHPAWNPDGTAIMCQRELQATLPDGTFQEKGLYRFEWSSRLGEWVNVGVLFDTPSDAELETAMDVDSTTGLPLFPASQPSPLCKTRAWKSGQWCHSDDFAIATLACSDDKWAYPGFGYDIFTSRVVLIDMRDAAPVIHDLTRELKKQLIAAGETLDEGTWHSIFAACGPPG